MNNQIPLKLRKVITYQTDNFYWHLGLRRIKSYFEQDVSRHTFSATYLYGSPRSGKTHLSIVLSQFFTNHNFYPQIITADNFDSQTLKPNYTDQDVLIIDDFQNFLTNIYPEAEDLSSRFIDLYESVKRNSAKLIIFADQPFQNYILNDHLSSRLANMQIYSLDNVQDEDLSKMIFTLAKQRGILLNEAHQEYLAKRLPRSISLIEAYLERLTYFLTETGIPLTRANLSKAL